MVRVPARRTAPLERRAPPARRAAVDAVERAAWPGPPVEAARRAMPGAAVRAVRGGADPAASDAVVRAARVERWPRRVQARHRRRAVRATGKAAFTRTAPA